MKPLTPENQEYYTGVLNRFGSRLLRLLMEFCADEDVSPAVATAMLEKHTKMAVEAIVEVERLSEEARKEAMH